MVTFGYTKDVYSPSDRSGRVGETRDLMFEVAQMLEQQGYGYIIEPNEDETVPAESDDE